MASTTGVVKVRPLDHRGISSSTSTSSSRPRRSSRAPRHHQIQPHQPHPLHAPPTHQNDPSESPERAALAWTVRACAAVVRDVSLSTSNTAVVAETEVLDWLAGMWVEYMTQLAAAVAARAVHAGRTQPYPVDVPVVLADFGLALPDLVPSAAATTMGLRAPAAATTPVATHADRVARASARSMALRPLPGSAAPPPFPYRAPWLPPDPRDGLIPVLAPTFGDDLRRVPAIRVARWLGLRTLPVVDPSIPIVLPPELPLTEDTTNQHRPPILPSGLASQQPLPPPLMLFADRENDPAAPCVLVRVPRQRFPLHIPPGCPKFPANHTYKRTPVFPLHATQSTRAPLLDRQRTVMTDNLRRLLAAVHPEPVTEPTNGSSPDPSQPPPSPLPSSTGPPAVTTRAAAAATTMKTPPPGPPPMTVTVRALADPAAARANPAGVLAPHGWWRAPLLPDPMSDLPPPPPSPPPSQPPLPMMPIVESASPIVDPMNTDVGGNVGGSRSRRRSSTSGSAGSSSAPRRMSLRSPLVPIAGSTDPAISATSATNGTLPSSNGTPEAITPSSSSSAAGRLVLPTFRLVAPPAPPASMAIDVDAFSVQSPTVEAAPVTSAAAALPPLPAIRFSVPAVSPTSLVSPIDTSAPPPPLLAPLPTATAGPVPTVPLRTIKLSFGSGGGGGVPAASAAPVSAPPASVSVPAPTTVAGGSVGGAPTTAATTSSLQQPPPPTMTTVEPSPVAPSSATAVVATAGAPATAVTPVGEEVMTPRPPLARIRLFSTGPTPATALPSLPETPTTTGTTTITESTTVTIAAIPAAVAVAASVASLSSPPQPSPLSMAMPSVPLQPRQQPLPPDVVPSSPAAATPAPAAVAPTPVIPPAPVPVPAPAPATVAPVTAAGTGMRFMPIKLSLRAAPASQQPPLQQQLPQVQSPPPPPPFAAAAATTAAAATPTQPPATSSGGMLKLRLTVPPPQQQQQQQPSNRSGSSERQKNE
ncbi:hypothetical protein BC828DRAFT_417374 [Blastocladiella britannica]|nr:hypothetical protein BC828DRAFT_417374 [Blastocladiella britannica]